MGFFVRGVVYGFALSLGSALFKKVQPHIGLGEDKDKKSEPDVVRQDGGLDPKPES
jgi:hypothetical protein